MGKLYSRFRIFLLMLTLGLASVPFFNVLYDKWSEIPVELPQTNSDNPIYVYPKSANEIPEHPIITKAKLNNENKTNPEFVCVFPIQTNQQRYISVLKHPDYAQLPVALEELVAEKAKQNKNTFYVAKIDTSLGNFTNVYWKEENVLILLEPPTYDWKYALLWSRRYWEFKTDVVPTLNDVNGSSFLLTRADWRTLVSSCLRGDKFILNRNQK